MTLIPGQKQERVLHRFVLTEAEGVPGSFAGAVLRNGNGAEI